MEDILNRYPFDYYYRGSTEIAVLPVEAIEKGEPITGIQRLWLVIRGSDSTEDATPKSALVELYSNDSLQLEMQFLHVTVYLYDPDNEQG